MLFDVQIDLADESMPRIHERSIMDPEFKEGFFMYVTPDKKIRLIKADWIVSITVTNLEE